MKTEGKVARRYAQAMAELCSPVEAERVRDDLQAFAAVWANNKELRDALQNPAIPLEARKSILTDVSDTLSGPTQRVANLLTLLLDNGRISGVGKVAEAFGKIVDQLKKLLALEIESAREIPADEKASLISKLQTDFGTLASVQWSVNPSVIGGVRIKNGDTLFDSSVRGALDRARAVLLGTSVG